MSNTNNLPMTRSQLIDLINYKNKEKIEEIVNQIYNGVINHAKHSTEPVYHHEIPRTFTINKVYLENMNEILDNLKMLFPECNITHTLLSKGIDGKLYDIAKINDNILPLINSTLNNSYIVIDWTMNFL